MTLSRDLGMLSQAVPLVDAAGRLTTPAMRWQQAVVESLRAQDELLAGLGVGEDVQAFSDRLAEIAAAAWVEGDLIVFDGTSFVRLPAGTLGHVLTAQGAGAVPIWAAP